MQVTVRFFASLRDTVGESQCTLDLPEGVSLEQMVVRLLARFPTLEGHRESWHFAVNYTHAEIDTVLHPGDRVAVFPYIAGG